MMTQIHESSGCDFFHGHDVFALEIALQDQQGSIELVILVNHEPQLGSKLLAVVVHVHSIVRDNLAALSVFGH